MATSVEVGGRYPGFVGEEPGSRDEGGAAPKAIKATLPKPTTCRMFETPVIERFSRVHPIAPFVFWVPVLSYFLVRGVLAHVPIAAIAGLFVSGALLWSITEYLLHRYVFHRIGPGHTDRRMYFILHGVHHDFPQDATRLVMPLGVSIPIGVICYLALRYTLGLAAPTLIDPMFAGFGVGYLAYDGIHYATHHFKMTSRIGRFLKRHHMVHHHTGENARWGVSSPLWDYVFGTMGSTSKNG
jgi:sterol desaturase/sphingolipid hydroxylase (fatty acid hydroxylase superfamily)